MASVYEQHTSDMDYEQHTSDMDYEQDGSSFSYGDPEYVREPANPQDLNVEQLFNDDEYFSGDQTIIYSSPFLGPDTYHAESDIDTHSSPIMAPDEYLSDSQPAIYSSPFLGPDTYHAESDIDTHSSPIMAPDESLSDSQPAIYSSPFLGPDTYHAESDIDTHSSPFLGPDTYHSESDIDTHSSPFMGPDYSVDHDGLAPVEWPKSLSFNSEPDNQNLNTLRCDDEDITPSLPNIFPSLPVDEYLRQKAAQYEAENMADQIRQHRRSPSPLWIAEDGFLTSECPPGSNPTRYEPNDDPKHSDVSSSPHSQRRYISPSFSPLGSTPRFSSPMDD